MWITLEDGRRLNVRKRDFDILQTAIKEQHPKKIAQATLGMIVNSKMAVRILTNDVFEGLKKLE